MNENEPSDEVLTDDQLRFVAESAASIGGMNTRPMGVGILSLLDRLKDIELERAGHARELAVCDSLVDDAEVALEQSKRDAQDHKDTADYWKAVAEKAGAALNGTLATIHHLHEGMSWISGHDRKGLDHLEEAMEACAERDAAEKRAENAEAALASARAEGGREALLATADDLMSEYGGQGNAGIIAAVLTLRDRAEALGGGQ